jgi:hypothetical protein
VGLKTLVGFLKNSLGLKVFFRIFMSILLVLRWYSSGIPQECSVTLEVSLFFGKQHG